MSTIIRFTTDNRLIVSAYPEGEHEQLRMLQDCVGGYIEIVHSPRLDDDLVLIVNESGRIRRLHANHAASVLADQLICGDAVLAQVDGENITGFDDDELENVLDQINIKFDLIPLDHEDDEEVDDDDET